MITVVIESKTSSVTFTHSRVPRLKPAHVCGTTSLKEQRVLGYTFSRNDDYYSCLPKPHPSHGFWVSFKLSWVTVIAAGSWVDFWQEVAGGVPVSGPEVSLLPWPSAGLSETVHCDNFTASVSKQQPAVASRRSVFRPLLFLCQWVVGKWLCLPGNWFLEV